MRAWYDGWTGGRAFSFRHEYPMNDSIIQNISYNNIRITDPFPTMPVFNLDNYNQDVTNMTFSDISYSNIQVKKGSTKGIKNVIRGTSEKINISNIAF